MPTEKDLFSEEESMVSMSFGDHIEDLRYRLVLALIGLFVGMVITFIPIPVLGESIGMYVFDTMERPARTTLDEFYKNQAVRESAKANLEKRLSPAVKNYIPAPEFLEQVAAIAPRLAPMLPDPRSDAVKDKKIALSLTAEAGDQILSQVTSTF